MDKKLKVAGIYDKRTIQRLKEVGISHYNFDFRARSFNFLQQHSFMELQKELELNETIYLQFENEADFVINKILSDLSEEKKNIVLEFSDIQDGNFYDQFGRPFIWHYSLDCKSFSSIAKSKHIKGIVLKFSDLLSFHNESILHNFCNNFHASFYSLLSSDDFKLTLELDWDSNLFSSISTYFDFDILSIPISNKVEICYRNVDLAKVQNHVHHLRKLTL